MRRDEGGPRRADRELTAVERTRMERETRELHDRVREEIVDRQRVWDPANREARRTRIDDDADRGGTTGDGSDKPRQRAGDPDASGTP